MNSFYYSTKTKNVLLLILFSFFNFILTAKGINYSETIHLNKSYDSNLTLMSFDSYVQSITLLTSSNEEFVCDPPTDSNDDHDLDGIANDCDLDDDNDGILDTDEGYICSTEVTPNSVTTTSTEIDPSLPITRTADNSFITYGGGYNGDASLDGTVTYTYDEALYNVTEFVIYPNGGNQSNDGQVTDIGHIWFYNSSSRLIYDRTNISVTQASTNVKTVVTLPTLNDVKYFRIGGLQDNDHPTEPHVIWKEVALNGCTFKDSDGDSIPDHFDNDSDNDGCPDALESGTSNFDYSDLKIDGSVDTSLPGNQVDSNGQPGSADNGVGSSTDPNVQAAECDPCNSSSSLFSDNDADGVGDVCDLDDDNDGILDISEGYLCGTTDMSEFIGLSSSSPTGSSQSIQMDGYPAGENVTLTMSNSASDGTFKVSATPYFYERDLVLGGDGHGISMNGRINSTESKTSIFEYDSPVYNLRVRICDIEFGNLSGSESATLNAYLEDGSVVNLGSIDVTKYKFNYYNHTLVNVDTNPTLNLTGNTIDGTTNFAHMIYDFDFSSATVTQGIKKVEIIVSATTTSDNMLTMAIFDFSYCSNKDTDSDGLADHLDTDADDDGCPDAVEGDGTFALSDLDANDMLTGPDADGDGVIDGADQGVGSSTDNAVFACNVTIAEDDINQTEIGRSVQGNVMTNDYDPEGDTQTVSLIDTDGDGIPDTAPIAGTPLQITQDGVVVGEIELDPATGLYTFTPDPTYQGGEVEIPYTICDDGVPSACDTATLVIEVINDDGGDGYSPFVINDEAATYQDTPVTVNILANDSDPDGNIDPQSVQLVDPVTGNLVTSLTIPGEGTYTVNPDGSVTFDPDPNFIGEATPVTYQACDDNSPTPKCSTGKLTITVVTEDASGNSTYAFDDANSGSKNETLTGNVLENDQDLEGDTQSVSLIDTDGDGIPDSAPTAGTPIPISLNGSVVGNITIDPVTGDYVWVPVTGFEGSVSIAMQVCDDNTTIGVACDNSTLILSNLGAKDPDFTPNITITPVQGIVGATDMRIILRVQEILGGSSTGPLRIIMPKIDFYNFTYEPTATTVGGISVNNSDWTFTDSGGFWVWTRNSTQAGFEGSLIGLLGVFEAAPGTGGTISFVVQILNGSGGDIDNMNNTDYGTVSY